MTHQNCLKDADMNIEPGMSVIDNCFSALTTEEVNERTLKIDECSTLEMLELMNNEDALVHKAVREELPVIAQAVEIICKSLKSGGRMFYVGAGTSGRLGILDASECPPTFGTDPEMIQAYIAGGDTALRTAIEGCEDNREAGAQLIRECRVNERDVVIGITASGGAPFVLAAVEEARNLGAATIGVVNNKDSKLSRICDVCISPVVGPEVIIGSTRLKSGTAQKLVLNMLTTCSMIKLGKVYGNLMVDLKATNNKLQDRAQRIVCYVTGTDKKTALDYLQKANMNTKEAILMIESGLSAKEAGKILEQHGGRLKDSLNAVRCSVAKSK